MFDSFSFASFGTVFVTGFRITCPVCILEVDVRLGPSIVDCLELMVMRMGRWSLSSEVETDQCDSCAMSLEAKLMLGEVDRHMSVAT